MRLREMTFLLSLSRLSGGEEGLWVMAILIRSLSRLSGGEVLRKRADEK